MLVTGITLEVHAIVPAIKNVDPLFPEWKSAQNKNALEYSEPVLILNLSIPRMLDGTIKITAIRKEEQTFTNKKNEILTFKKEGENITYTDMYDKTYADEKFIKSPLGYKRAIEFEDGKHEISAVTLEAYDIYDIYTPIAKDTIRVENKQ